MGFFAKLNMLDSNLLLHLNDNYSRFWDSVMYLGTDKLFWVPLFATLLYFIFRNKGREGILILIFLILTLVLNDSISTFMKESIQRLRPTHDPSLMFDLHVVNGYRGGLYGFVSSHAANSFGLALFLSLLIRNHFFSFTIFAWAVFHSYTRIYLGVHFPFDILGGATLGLLIGYLMFLLFQFTLKRFQFFKAIHPDMGRTASTPTGFDLTHVILMGMTVIFSFIFLMLTATRVIDFMS